MVKSSNEGSQICLWYWRCTSGKEVMFMRVAALVFLCLARIRFPKTESIPSIIWSDKVLREVRQFEKLDHKLRKVQLDLVFLCKCKNSDVIPKFLNFLLANKKLQDSLIRIFKLIC